MTDSKPPRWMPDSTSRSGSIRTCSSNGSGSFVVDDAHAEAIKKLQTILGLEIAVKASEDLNREQASDVEPFQNHLPTPEATEEGPILVVTADCKGVPLVRKALPPEEATDTPLPGPGEPAPRQGREGEQEEDGGGGRGLHDRTVCAHRRRGDRRSHEGEGRQASPEARAQAGACRVAGGQGGVVPLAGRRGRAAQPEGTKPLVFLSDGERALHDRQGEYLPEDVICILDLFHVMERLWKAAWCFFDEATQKREAHQWVEKELRMLLEGKVGSVVGGLRQMMTKRELKGAA